LRISRLGLLYQGRRRKKRKKRMMMRIRRTQSRELEKRNNMLYQ
jgi:hypothetical protein